MKYKITLIIICIIYGIYLNGIAKDINPLFLPKEVKMKFQSLYPEITEDINWQKKSNKYQADFILNNKSISLVFNKKGNLLNSRIEIDLTELPPIVLMRIQNSYINNKYKILYLIKKSEWRIDFPEKVRDFFEVQAMKGRLMYIIRYSKEGKILHIFDLNKRSILDESWWNNDMFYF